MPTLTFELQYNPYVIKLSPAQQETLAALARLSGGKLVWVSTVDIVAERLRTKGLESGKSKQAAGFRLSTENALGQIKNVIPQLVLSNVDSWKLTVPGGCVVEVQLGVTKLTK